MGKVSIPKLATGNSITSSSINTFITSLNGLNGNINADNVSDGGIDRRNLVLRSVQDTSRTVGGGYFVTNTDLTVQELGGYREILPASGPKLKVGPIDCENGDTFLIHCSFSIDLFSNLGNANTGFLTHGMPQVKFLIEAQDQYGVAQTNIHGSKRAFRSSLLDGTVYPATRTSCTIVVAYEAPTTTGVNAGKNRMSFELKGFCQFSLLTTTAGTTNGNPNINAEVENAQIFARVIKR